MSQNSIQPSKFRPIAPRANLDSSTEFKSEIRSTEQINKAKRAPIACMECRRYRTKCSTQQPCSECAAHNRECVYDHSADKRRKEHLERKEQLFQNQLDKCHHFITSLLNCIRFANDDQINYLIGVIRSTDDYETIEAAVNNLIMIYTEHDGEGEDAEHYADEGPARY